MIVADAFGLRSRIAHARLSTVGLCLLREAPTSKREAIVCEAHDADGTHLRLVRDVFWHAGRPQLAPGTVEAVGGGCFGSLLAARVAAEAAE